MKLFHSIHSAVRFFPLICLTIIFLAISGPSVSLGAETYKIDPVHSSIIFKVSHLGVAPFYGRFNNASGHFVIDENEPGKNFADVSVKVEDVDTFNQQRDDHLKNEDFFHASQYPVIHFKTESFKKMDNEKFKVTGQLSLHGTTKSIAIEVHRTGAGEDPWGNYRMGFETTFSIKRSDFGMDKLLHLVGDEVDLMIAIEGIRQ